MQSLPTRTDVAQLVAQRSNDGRMVSLWRAVDAEGEVLDVLVQAKRNKRGALTLMRKLLKKYGFVPDKLITDGLRSYRAAVHDLGISDRPERGRWRNNRADDSQPKDFSQPMQPPTIPSTSSAISFQQDPPSLSRFGYEHVARRSRGRLKIFETQNSRVLLSTT